MRIWLVFGALVVVGVGWLGQEVSEIAPRTELITPARSVAGPAVPLDSSMDLLPEMETSLVVAGLDRPTFAIDVGDGRLFIAEKRGTIRVAVDGELLPEPFLDLDDEVPHHRPERGLLAMAIHPDFDRNGRFYVHLTDERGDSRLIEYLISDDDPNIADPASASLILHAEQPGEFHNGGMIQFGPDGHLFVGMGDGGFGEPARNAGLRNNVLGAILRIDVDAARPYGIPEDNPYVGTEFAPEIWMSGMRNPWRFFIDADTRTIAIGDVGQVRWEEMTVVPLDAGGLDLGWPVFEGRSCYEAEECDSGGLVFPDIVYSHSVGCAVIGGPIYRGSLIPQLDQMIVYADFCTGKVSAYSIVGGVVLRNQPIIAGGEVGPILSLATDADGEILLLTEKGEVRRLELAGE